MDSDFRAKIANFGLARSVEREGSEGEQYVMTRHIVGTRGYMAPEYLEYMVLCLQSLMFMHLGF